MSKKTKKTIVAVLIIVILLLVNKLDVFDFLDYAQDNDGSSEIGQILNVEEDEQQNENQPEYTGPFLRHIDYSKMDLFEDGYQEVKVDFCADGDTANFIVGNQKHKTRFLAVNTPEKDPQLREVEPWGNYASKFTKDALNNADEIILELDADSDVFDKYGRLLAWVWLDGKLLNYVLVDESLANVAYLYGDYKYTDELQDIEAVRKKQKKRIWGEKDPDFDYQ
jgi:micrococcal nuclease